MYLYNSCVWYVESSLGLKRSNVCVLSQTPIFEWHSIWMLADPATYIILSTDCILESLTCLMHICKKISCTYFVVIQLFTYNMYSYDTYTRIHTHTYTHTHTQVKSN